MNILKVLALGGLLAVVFSEPEVLKDDNANKSDVLKDDDAKEVVVVKIEDVEQTTEAVPETTTELPEDPCLKKKCERGRECSASKDLKAECVCLESCFFQTDERARVCSTDNKTFNSECEFYRQRCLCEENDYKCLDPRTEHAFIDYFGGCVSLPKCQDGEMEEYPFRLREWLFLVMKELADRKDLNEEATSWVMKSSKVTKRWVLPTIWKFCELDTSFDKKVTVRELMPLSAPLKALEHCTGPFLEKCDTDFNHEISLKEWGACLGLDPEDVEDQCDALRNSK